MVIAKFLILAIFDIVFITLTKNISITLLQILIIVKIFFHICFRSYILHPFFLSLQWVYCNHHQALLVHDSEQPARRMPGGNLSGNCKIALLFIGDLDILITQQIR